MSARNPRRQPAGSPAGGQFAAGARDESTASVSDTPTTKPPTYPRIVGDLGRGASRQRASRDARDGPGGCAGS